jgi:hypothetical protein
MSVAVVMADERDVPISLHTGGCVIPVSGWR